MSKITVTNSQQVTLTAVPVTSDPLSAVVKYGQSPELNLVLLPKLIAALDQPLDKAAATPASLDAQIGKAFNFGAGEPQFSITPGATAAIRVNAKKGADVFSDNLFKSQVTVNDGEGYLSLALTGSVTGKGSDKQGDITLGFQTGASATFEFFRRFKIDAAPPTVGQALGQVVSSFVMPADVTDLSALKEGDIATSSGKRNLKITAEFKAGPSAVPLATPNLPLANKPVDINASAKIDVSGSYEINSAWQIRARATGPGVVELGFYKQAGSDWDISVSASAGIDATVGTGKDLITAVIEGISKKPEADKQQLAAAGLQPDDIKAINKAISDSIDHSIHASLSVELKGLASDEAAFLYTVELAKLQSDSAAAVTDALDGDLTAINKLNPAGQDGVTLVRSILTKTRENGTTFKINFIGLFNFLSLADFISKSQVIHEPVSGDTVFSETASGQRIQAISLPQAQTKLRKLIFDSILMTTTYRTAGVLETMGMECSAMHFAMHSTTNEHTMSDYLDWFIALNLLDAPRKAAIMQNFHTTGASTCTARVHFDDAACKNLFLDASGNPKSSSYYAGVGRNALQALLLPPPGDQTDSDAYRREVLASDRIWNQFKGQTTIGPVMEQEKGWSLNDPRIAVLSADYTVIVWWAQAMSSTGAKILDMQNFLKTANPATLDSNKVFIAKKADVQKHVMSAVKNSPMSFDQPFGLVALDWAAAPAAVASGVLLSPAIHEMFGALASKVA